MNKLIGFTSLDVEGEMIWVDPSEIVLVRKFVPVSMGDHAILFLKNGQKINVNLSVIETIHFLTMEDIKADEIAVMEEALDFHPRAAKFMRKKKNFVVVACDEAYFKTVYDLIRKNEIERKRWAIYDEEAYIKATKGGEG